MENKKNANQTPEVGDEALDQVAGGMPLPDTAHHMAMGNFSYICKCWWCGREYSYAPGLNQNVPNNPWWHFCSAEHKLAYEEANHMISHDRT